MSTYGFSLVYRIGTVLDIRCATAGRVKPRCQKRIGVRARPRKLGDEHRAVDVSVAAATTVDVPSAEHHDHAVEVEVSMQSKLSGDNQSSLTGGTAWPEHKIAIYKSENPIWITGAEAGVAVKSIRSAAEVSSLVYGCIHHSFSAIQKQSCVGN